MRSSLMDKVRAMSNSDREASPEPARPLLTLADLAMRTGLSGSKLRRDIRSKELACLRFGRAIRITEEAYEAYLRRHRQGKLL
jgi:excisionase family DNA binding protein